MRKGKSITRVLSINHVLLVILAILCGFAAAVVDAIRVHGHMVFSTRCVWFTALIALLFVAFVLIGERFLVWCAKDRNKTTGWVAAVRKCCSFSWNYKQLFLITTVIILCWIPYIWLTYPGIIWFDTGEQLMQWFHKPNIFSDGSFWSNHHPVSDTLFFGIFAQLGKALGSVDLGLFLCSIVLALAAALSLATVVLYCRRIGASWRFCCVQLIFFSLFPVIPCFSISLVKDTVFMPLFVWYAVLYVQIVRSKGACLKSPLLFALFLLLSVLTALTKKTGLYIVLICCIALLFVVLRRYRLRVGAALLIELLVMVVLVPKVVFPMFHIQEGGKQEMLAVPFQQSALEVKRHGNEMNPEDIDVIHKILGNDVADKYQWWAADGVKGYTWDSRKDQYLARYAKAWSRGLVEHPLTYVEAYVALQEGWLGIPTLGSKQNPEDLTLPVFLTGSDHTSVAYSKEMGLIERGDINRVTIVQNKLNKFEHLPVLNLVFSRAIWSTWMFLFVVYEWFRRFRGKGWICLMPYIATFLFLWISPATVTIEGIRYVLPMIIMTPLMLGMLSAKKDIFQSCDSVKGDCASESSGLEAQYVSDK